MRTRTLPALPRIVLRRAVHVALLGSVACTSDLPAPNNYLQIAGTGSETGTGTGGELVVLCDDIPLGAVDATFGYAPTAMGGDASFTWSAQGLPDGLAIDPGTGQIAGVPTGEGTFPFTVTATDSSNGQASATCELEVRPRIEIDLDLALGSAPFCLRAPQTLAGFVVDRTGDGTPITCDVPGGGGNGRLPEGIDIDPSGCNLTGSLAVSRHGTWVWIVRGTQSGAEVFVPYCFTNEVDDPDFYTIEVEHSGLQADGVDPQASALIPIVRRFARGEPLDVGGRSDPLFRITDVDACPPGSGCTFGFAFGITASPFDGDAFGVPGATLITQMGQPIGFTHELTASGPAVAQAFEDRPWVMSLAMDYCLSGVPEDCSCPDTDTQCCVNQDPMQPDCETAASRVRENGNGNLETAILMLPQ